MIINFSVTLEDVTRSEKIYGTTIAALKGKTIWTNTDPVVTEYITPPQEIIKSNKNINISGDIIFVNHIPFFATNSRNIKFNTIKCIRKMTQKNITNSLITVNYICIRRGFNIKTDLMDR